MVGKRISGPNFFLMFCVDAKCENRLSIDKPSQSQFICLKVLAALAKPMTSARCENKLSHLPL